MIDGWSKFVYTLEIIELVGCIMLFVGFIITITNRRFGAIVGLISSVLILVYYVPGIYGFVQLVGDQKDRNIAIDFSVRVLITSIGIPLLLMIAICLSIYSVRQSAA